MGDTSAPHREKLPFFQRKWVKRSLTVLLVITLILIVAMGAVWWFAGKSHPSLDGEVLETAVENEVEVLRDGEGTAKVTASSLEDLFYTQGYVMAQDRLFQMDMTRRLAGGRLAEVIGSDALESDKYFRSYGMHRAAEAEAQNFAGETERMVSSFADGVTAYIEDAFDAGEQPLEFRILGYEPEPWTPEDTAIAVKYMGYTLTGNFREELENYELVRRIGPEAAALFPDYTQYGEFPIITESSGQSAEEAERAGAFENYYEDSILDLEEVKKLVEFTPDSWNGSNNWVISGDHTESGMPMIGNDPHLGLAVPSVWYQTHLELEEDFHSIGVTVPGIPGVVLGHNGSVSWGVTSLSADYEDVFLEQVNPNNPNEYLYDGEWEEAEAVEEEIHIDDEDLPYMHRVEITRNGPVMNKVMEEGPYQAFSMRWSGLEQGRELDDILNVSRAEDAYEFMDSLDGFVTPGLSWVFADTENNIGYRGQALLPERGESDGRFPVPGWDPDYQWEGFIPSDEMPEMMNPEEGYIMTANNMPVGEDYEYEIGRSYFPYRAIRLEEMIEEKLDSGEKFSLEDMGEMQLDLTNTQARMLLPYMLDALEEWTPDEAAENLEGEQLGSLSEMEENVLNMMREWDYVESKDSPEALVWQIWYESLPQNLFERYLQVEVTNHLTRHHVIQQAADDEESLLFSYLDERWHVSFPKAARETFHEAVKEAEEMQGSAPENWEWGEWHKLHIEHPLGAVRPLDLLFNIGGWETGGSGATPGAVSYDVETGAADHAAGWRFIGDLSSTDAFYDVNIPGQSGQWLSPHYDDQMDAWVDGEYYPMEYNKEAGGGTGRVEFVPEQ
ncbi:MAG: penicillin acylase family protein [Alkalicoccus sp.]|nr:MAG: penicillin acylase family protein [Alkalicoccus sp.]